MDNPTPTTNEQPEPLFTPVWFDAQIAAQQARTQQLSEALHQAIGALQTLVALREQVAEVSKED